MILLKNTSNYKSNYKRAVIFGLVGWLLLATFSVFQYSKIARQTCYFDINWLFCSPHLSVALRVILVLVVFIIFSCLFFSGFFTWKLFEHPAKAESKKKIFFTIVFFVLLASLVVPFSSTDITFYYYSGKAAHSGINPYTQAWSRSNPFMSPVVNLNDKNGFAYGPIVAHVFNAVYSASRDNIAIFIILWKILGILLFSLCGWLIYKFLDFYSASSEKNYFWLFWFLQPLILFEWMAIGHFDSIWLIFIILSLILVQRKKWWLVLPCLIIGVWLKFIPIFFLPWFAIRWWQEVNWQNWKKMIGGQIIGIVISIAITVFSWTKLWQGFAVFEPIARISKWAATSTFALIYYSLEPLFRMVIGANFHWYLTRFVQFGLMALILYLMYPFLKKAVKVIFKRDIFNESDFLAALFVSVVVYLIFWQKSFWPWYMIWLLTLGIIAYVKSKNKYIKKITVWVSLSPLFYYFVFMLNFQITNGGDATVKLWFCYYVVLSFFAYPAYVLFKWRKVNYKLDV